MPTNRALYIPSPGAPFTPGPAEMPTPGPHELVIKNTSLALNPLDYKIKPSSYPYVAGVSFAGTVEKVGTALQTKYQPHDHVVAGRLSSQENAYGAFQQYVLVDETAVAKLDETVSLDDASAVVAGVVTVVGALHICMGLSLPTTSTTAGSQAERVLIYGGSSTLGMGAAQFALHAGYTVVTTSSPANRAQVARFCPQSAIVDHTLAADALIEALAREGPYEHIFDAVGTPATAAILATAVAAATPATGVSMTIWSSRPGREERPEGVTVRGESYPRIVQENERARRWLFDEYLPQGLASKTIGVPDIEKRGGGLESVPGLLQQMQEVGFSGKKVVVDMSQPQP
jgi:NADPH:quinone reductase-like Zn-dependent oxidoreductase